MVVVTHSRERIPPSPLELCVGEFDFSRAKLASNVWVHFVQHDSDTPSLPSSSRHLLPQFVEQWVQNQPKGVPLHVRQTFDYFIFMAPPTNADKDNVPATAVTLTGNPMGTAEASHLPPPAPAAVSCTCQPAGDGNESRCRSGSVGNPTGGCSSSPAENPDKVPRKPPPRVPQNLDLYRILSPHYHHVCTVAGPTIFGLCNLRSVPGFVVIHAVLFFASNAFSVQVYLYRRLRATNRSETIRKA